jgi:hypothetical protein
MKPVTKDRILKTLDRISSTCHARDKYADVLRQATRNGMKAVFHGHVPSIDNDKNLIDQRLAHMTMGKRGSPVASALGGNATSAVLTAHKYS